MVFLHLCYKEYTTRIKPLRKLCTHHLSYNFTFCVPFIITILYYLFLNVLIENVKTFVCVRYLYFFAFGMPWLILVVSIAMSKPRLIIRLFRGHKINFLNRKYTLSWSEITAIFVTNVSILSNSNYFNIGISKARVYIKKYVYF